MTTSKENHSQPLSLQGQVLHHFECAEQKKFQKDQDESGCNNARSQDSTWKEWLNLCKNQSVAEGKRPTASLHEQGRTVMLGQLPYSTEFKTGLVFNKSFVSGFLNDHISGCTMLFHTARKHFLPLLQYTYFCIEEMAAFISCQSLLQHQAARSYPKEYSHIAQEQFSMFVKSFLFCNQF